MLGTRSRLQPVVILVPMAEEMAPFRDRLADWRVLGSQAPWEAFEARAGDRRVVLLLTDCGPVNAGAATERAMLEFNPGVVLHGGAAGAHDPSLLPGDVVIAAETCGLFPPAHQEARLARGLHPKQLRFRRDGRRVHLSCSPADPRLVAGALRIAREELPSFGTWDGPGWPVTVPRRPGRVVVGLVGSTDLWHVEAGEIAAYRRYYGTACEDMESAFVAQVCAMHAVPFCAVRAIAVEIRGTGVVRGHPDSRTEGVGRHCGRSRRPWGGGWPSSEKGIWWLWTCCWKRVGAVGRWRGSLEWTKARCGIGSPVGLWARWTGDPRSGSDAHLGTDSLSGGWRSNESASTDLIRFGCCTKSWSVSMGMTEATRQCCAMCGAGWESRG